MQYIHRSNLTYMHINLHVHMHHMNIQHIQYALTHLHTYTWRTKLLYFKARFRPKGESTMLNIVEIFWIKHLLAQ